VSAMGFDEPHTEDLLDRAGRGDTGALESLLTLDRRRLKDMVGVHMDPRLLARFDPSDVGFRDLMGDEPLGDE